MKRAIQTNRQIEPCHKRYKHLQGEVREDFLYIWQMLGKLPTPVKKFLLLYLPEDYLWTFWQHFSGSFYRDTYFSQYEIKTNFGERVIEQTEKGNVFMNLKYLSLSYKHSFCVCTFNRAFPVLKKLSLSEVRNAKPMLRMTHPALEVIRLRNVRSPKLSSVLGLNWLVNFPKLKLLENNLVSCNNYVTLCRSSGLPLMKPERGTNAFCIIHLETLTDGSGSLDISLLPEGPDCLVIFLAAKRFTNIEKMLKIQDKFPVLQQVRIYTTSILDEELIHKVSRAIGSCLVGDLRQLKLDMKQT